MEAVAFFSYNSRDREAVTKVADVLTAPDVKIWLDEYCLRPGVPFQEELEKALQQCTATVVFIGPHGLGPWQEEEARLAVEGRVEQKKPLIVAFLPGAPADAAVPSLIGRGGGQVDLRQGLGDERAIAKLRWGITGVKPAAPAAGQPSTGPPPLDPLDAAVESLASVLGQSNISFFVGGAASNLSPTAFEISRELLSELKLIEPDHDGILPGVDSAGTCYALGKTEPALQPRIRQFIGQRSRTVPPVFDLLAGALKALTTSRSHDRGLTLPRQLIVTTEYDLLVEWALLRAGLPFTRIVHYRSADRVDVEHYGGGLRLERPDDRNELDRLIGTRARKSPPTRRPGAISLKDLPEPILYKFRGSLDLPDSCLISTDHHLHFTRKVLETTLIPAQISDIVSSTSAAFLAYNFLEPGFRLMCHTLLRALKKEVGSNYGFHLRPVAGSGEKVEHAVWEKLKKNVLGMMNIDVVEAAEEDFLKRLMQRVGRG